MKEIKEISWGVIDDWGVVQIRLKRVNYKLDSGKIIIFANENVSR